MLKINMVMVVMIMVMVVMGQKILIVMENWI